MPATFLLLFLLSISTHESSNPPSVYEEQEIEIFLNKSKLILETNPEGESIRSIRIVNLSIFSPHDFWPTWFNAFHITTQKKVIEKELLFKINEPFNLRSIDESSRNLRRLGIFSIAQIFAIQTPNPNEIDVIVYTRDLWSIRLEESFLFAGNSLQYLHLQLVERNFLGLQMRPALSFSYYPLTIEFSEDLSVSRLFGKNLFLYEQADLILNHQSGKLEGGRVNLQLGSPFYSLAQEWRWMTVAQVTKQISRNLIGNDISTYTPSGSSTAMARQWDNFLLNIQGAAGRHFGHNVLHTLEGGINIRFQKNNMLDDGHDPSYNNPSAADIQAFTEEVMPRSFTNIGPALAYTLFTPRYKKYFNVDAFGVSEDARLGPAFALKLSLPIQLFGSNANEVILSTILQYFEDWSGWLFAFNALASADWLNDDFYTFSASASTQIATPRTVAGRVALNALWALTWSPILNQIVSLGSNNGLRGYDSDAFYLTDGGQAILFNLEYRTPPLTWETILLGGVLFFDAGSVFKTTPSDFHCDIGIGVRLQLPQFNRTPFRFDFALPLEGRGFRMSVTLGADQDFAIIPAPSSIEGYTVIRGLGS